MANPRRNILKGALLSALGLGLQISPVKAAGSAKRLKGSVRHSVARWTFQDMPLAQLCELVKSIGFSAIDLVGPEDWPTLKQYGVDCSMCNGAELNLTDGWCDARFHDVLIARYQDHIEKVAAAGYKNLICFSGNARGMTPKAGLENAVAGLSKIMPLAEQKGVTLQMELFNSKVDHPDYMADNSAWGIALCKRLGSPNFKLLYDIYHMQISEGDIIRTITENSACFGHYHTAGVPGRHELSEDQELYYPAIVRAIQSTGFDGYVAQEFIPTPTTMAGKSHSLQQAVLLCDV